MLIDETDSWRPRWLGISSDTERGRLTGLAREELAEFCRLRCICCCDALLVRRLVLGQTSEASQRVHTSMLAIPNALTLAQGSPQSCYTMRLRKLICYGLLASLSSATRERAVRSNDQFSDHLSKTSADVPLNAARVHSYVRLSSNKVEQPQRGGEQREVVHNAAEAKRQSCGTYRSRIEHCMPQLGVYCFG